MSECVGYKTVSSMTGSSRTGPPQPQEEEPVSSFDSPEKQVTGRKMTPVQQQTEQFIQLTPLWEHVVRTQQFPPDVDTCLVFNEISSRLRDPEWEVRQHALRVLVDVIPTLDEDHVDEIMEPVVGELINNLGHLAPAVRKGALDTLRVYLLYSSTRDAIIKTIIDKGINRNNFDIQSHITLGVILSAPSLLFPSSRSIKPSRQSLKTVINALASRLSDINYQEIALKSLVKIRDVIGDEFVSYLEDCPGAKEDFDNLSQVYNVHSMPKRSKKIRKKKFKHDKLDKVEAERSNDEEKRERENKEETIPPSRVVLETEIKFNEQTAITMTILEEKDDDSDDSLDSPLKLDDSSKLKDESKEMWIERRKTPRRVHFGGEIVKLRTPDSDDSQMIQSDVPVTRIPLPISPVTKMPSYRPPRSLSHPCTPSSRCQVPKRSRSVSASPKRGYYVHDGSLNPKKSILMKTSAKIKDNSNNNNINNNNSNNNNNNKLNNVDGIFGIKESDRSWSFEVFESIEDKTVKKESNLFVEKRKKKVKTSASKSAVRIKSSEESVCYFNKFDESGERTNEINFVEYPEAKVNSGNSNRSGDLNLHAKSFNTIDMVNSKGGKNNLNLNINNDNKLNEGRSKNSANYCFLEDDKLRSPKRVVGFESFPRKERNYILMELSSPIKSGNSRQVSPISVSSSSVDAAGSGRDGVQSNENTQEPKSLSDRVSIGELNAPVVLSTNDTFKEESLNTENSKTLGIEENKKVVAVEAREKDTKEKENEEKEKGKDKKKEINENNKESKKFCDSKTIAKNFDSGNESHTCSSSEGENKTQEPSWEELGLVDQEVLNDLHNKDDWRARVRGLERVASALRTSSALIAIEPRLGSLLHAVLGCERSCRVAAAGMAVARVVVAGVSEEALKRRLPQVAWGLTRQGGPNAAQLARIAMLRLRPALFLEQLLQPHCIDARNAKTRENALQLLIFSLVTFPSTEFKVENVANKVALMVGDRRRRVRQAALDTLAVLAQIYEPEEVLQAGQRAAKQLRETSDMVAAIRARLARKSLPMVSADGLVVYGLQISPTVQIATGPDVDWIVAGSGSVSPGTGRARGQIITINPRANFDKISQKNDTEENSSSHDRNLVARGIGLHPKNEKPVAWQLVSAASKDDNKLINGNKKEKNSTLINGINDNNNSGIKKRLEDSASPFISSLDSIEDSYGTDVNISLIKNDQDVIMKQRKTEENFHRRMDEIYAERPHQDIIRLESRIPVAQFRDRDIVVRHSTAYSRRRRAVKTDEYETSSSAPQTSYGQRDDEINRRYRSDRIKLHIRPGSDDRSELTSPQGASNSPQMSPVHDITSVPGYRRRQSIIQTTVSKSDRHIFPSIIESRCKSVAAAYGKPFTPVQTIDSYSRRISSSPVVIKIDKTNIDEELNEKNRCNSAQISTHCINNLTDLSTHYLGRDREPYGVSSDSSNDRDNEPLQDHEVNEDNSHRSASIITKSFDIITHESNPSRRNSIDQIPVTVLSSATNSTDLDKETSSDDIASGRELDSDDPLTRNPPSGSSVVSNESSSADEAIREVISPNHRDTGGIQAIAFDEHDSPDVSLAYDREYSTELQIDIESRACSSINSPNKFFHSVVCHDDEDDDDDDEELEENNNGDEDENENIDLDIGEDVSDDINVVKDVENENGDEDDKEISEYKIDEMSTSITTTTTSSISGITTTSSLTTSTSTSSSNSETVKNLVSIVVASRPHSRAATEYHETTTAVTFQPLDIRQSREGTSVSGEASVIHDPNDTLTLESNDHDGDISVKSKIVSVIKHPSDENPDTEIHVVTIEKIHQTLTSSRENGIVPEIARIHMDNNATESPTKRLQSKVPRSRVKMKTGLNKVAPALPINNNEKSFNKSKPIIPQCFSQLESNDWEVTIKGLKELSIIARQQRHLLDNCPQNLVGRLLGRHIRNLRSQVARTACMAAGDVFESQARSIDHDLDDIAGPLLHRTADTNRFLRSDSNAALDRMIEHLPPHRTISVIIHRGAGHQNAVVRAATARLLASVVERMGPDSAMTLPRDVREKLLSTGAKLLMDGNLDARNQAKLMFKQLSRCEGFRRALKDSVPDTTLRHIDKTLRSL
ncbi:uncharacterized protein LOC103575564 isoform X1 [Microplitis demolitor]|uniref:uncharacterized protein LOC103575564 isoform X1 n=1 Tax=Microplitis demolitor TaxID=69319 RepID=UPI0004CD0D59|nr:uncharacterized protein LOC103575564 isoform X1 [Microplitis demolitor]XP_053595791.1 uncharacterized protein LOC103575564 isoform X1 [Microplitis demolitor]